MTHLHPRVALSLKTVRRFGWINSGAQYSDQGMVNEPIPQSLWTGKRRQRSPDHSWACDELSEIWRSVYG